MVFGGAVTTLTFMLISVSYNVANLLIHKACEQSHHQYTTFLGENQLMLFVPDTCMGSAVGAFFAFADYNVPACQRVAELAEPDIIFLHHQPRDEKRGFDGTIQGAFLNCGIPSITLELGSGDEWHKPTIQRGVDYLHRLLVDMGIRSGSLSSTRPYEPDLSKTVVSRVLHYVPARFGGWVDMFVNPGEFVQPGQILANVLNSWGDVLEEVAAPVEGTVLYRPRHPGMEAGGTVVALVYSDIEGVDVENGLEFTSRFPYKK